MADIKKVIKCLELCRTLTDSCEGCPYENVPPVENCMLTMPDDALKLLKEQETEIRQLRLALDIAKGTCKGIAVETDEKFMGDL